eukprot:COSAG02_NODE_4272_length_5563_cov_1.811310_6_plen_121_part_00
MQLRLQAGYWYVCSSTLAYVVYTEVTASALICRTQFVADMQVTYMLREVVAGLFLCARIDPMKPKPPLVTPPSAFHLTTDRFADYRELLSKILMHCSDSAVTMDRAGSVLGKRKSIGPRN